MSEKRRDNKGRILKTGESQRKDGRYLYKYTDSFGEPQFVYSWKLVATDRVPAGKRDCISLREKIAELQKDIHDGIDVVGKKMTLCQLYAKQNAQRPKVRKNTETGRKYLMDILKKDKLGARSIDSIKPSDAKEWAIRMSENGYAYQTINNYKRSLKASFYIAIHVETVALLSKLDVDKHISVEIELDEMNLTSAESKATYAQIKEYVWNKFELKVSTLYIAQIKKKCGIELREHYNKSKKDKQIIPQCTPEKEEAIMDALRHFKMI
ncbi:Mobile element protein [Streptococcus pneumoniae]|nr:Mobile element protein [Streptococcus pneumoniae]HET2310430.1 integrase DNA-binding domain-containing protein [Streptococcus pneumoniae]HET2312048.1 integrase DNA-binding domain-containing protein [Streptococcus pneumoniae]